MHGIPKESTPGDIYTLVLAERYTAAPGTVARTLDCIGYPPGVRLIMLDYGPEPEATHRLTGTQDLMDRLAAIWPAFADMGWLVATSTSSAIRDRQTYTALVAEARARIAPEQRRLIREHITSATPDLPEATIEQDITTRLDRAERGALDVDQPLYFDSGMACTAGTLSKAQDGKRLRDPLEPDYGPSQAVFHWRGGDWRIVSWAHGVKRVYQLCPTDPTPSPPDDGDMDDLMARVDVDTATIVGDILTDDGAWEYFHAGGVLGQGGQVTNTEVSPPSGLERLVIPDPPTGTALQQGVRASLSRLDLAPDHVSVPLWSALWRAVLGSADFGVHLTGPTGTAKTELATLVQQHFGSTFDARHLPGSWLSTGNSLEDLAFTALDRKRITRTHREISHIDSSLPPRGFGLVRPPAACLPAGRWKRTNRTIHSAEDRSVCMESWGRRSTYRTSSRSVGC